MTKAWLPVFSSPRHLETLPLNQAETPVPAKRYEMET